MAFTMGGPLWARIQRLQQRHRCAFVPAGDPFIPRDIAGERDFMFRKALQDGRHFSRRYRRFAKAAMLTFQEFDSVPTCRLIVRCACRSECDFVAYFDSEPVRDWMRNVPLLPPSHGRAPS